jgi:tRNA(Arg) A34 adenosine deaminase TadA
MIMGKREEQFMQMAVRLSREGMDKGNGGPFGSIVVKDNEVIGKGYNSVLSDHDPTAHAEIIAIRDACNRLNSFHLEGCEIYTSCEPCPMCLGAIYWARPDKVYFANTRKNAEDIGFDDSLIYNEIALPMEKRKIPMIQLEVNDALKVFEEWKLKENKTVY